ncbi:MAG: Hpt domain-containing protein [Gammaproteobacteria bacterium]|nr:Hpt domain-containing protein [Gammaproteobacteria bacterium]
MGQDQENFALEWTKSEILETLVEARLALEAYVESGQESTRMRACLTGLHQVHGTLIMLELKGVSLLADHLEQLAQRLLGNEVDKVPEAAQSLMQGILELPGYIEEIQRGVPDTTQPMLPLVNELRAHLKQKPLGSEVKSLAPATDDSAVDRFTSIDGVGKVKKIRSAYQQVLLSILRGGDRARAVETLSKVALGLKRVCEHTVLEAQWQAFAEFVESLGNASGPLDSAAVKLLRRVDAKIRDLAIEGEAALRKPASQELVEQLLEAAERRDHQSEMLTTLKEAVRSDAGPSDGLTISGRQALASAAETLGEELALVGDQLDLFIRSDAQSTETLAELTGPLKRIGSTLSLLGFESSRAIIADQVTLLRDLVKGGAVHAPSIEAIAASLVQVDENLKSHRQGAPTQTEKITSDAQRTVVNEARNGLDQIKQSIVDYVSSRWDARHLDGVMDQLAVICGALNMIPLPRAARMLAGCAQVVQAEMLNDEKPEWERLDQFADALSGIDYYLERIAENNQAGAEDILDLVDKSLALLGVAGEEKPGAKPAAEPVDEATVDETSVDETSSVEGEFEIELEEGLQEAEEAIIEVEADLERAVPTLELEEDEDFDLTDLDFDEADADADGVAPEPAEAEPEPEARAEPKVIERETPKPFEVEQPDQEIVEIFVEEVTEVVANLNELLLQWQNNPANEEPLIEVRRGFHTLKGSGRIVGAAELGELAWSVENMLNRIIDGTVQANPQFITVVGEALQIVPGLRDAFEVRARPDMGPVGRVMERADVMASGGNIDETETPDAPATGATDQVVQPSADDELSQVIPIFVAEAEQHLAVLAARVVYSAEGAGGVEGADASMSLDEDAMRAWHTLKGSAAMVELEDVSLLVGPIYDAALAYRANFGDVAVTGDAGRFFVEALSVVEATVIALKHDGESPDPSQTIVDADHWSLQFGSNEANQRLLTLDGIEFIMNAQEFLAAWRDGGLDLAQSESVHSALRELEQAAQTIERTAIAELAAALTTTYEVLENGLLTEVQYQGLVEAHDRLLEQLDAIAADQAVPEADDVIAGLETLVEDFAVGPAVGSKEAQPEAAEGSEAEPQETVEANVVEFPSAESVDDEPPFNVDDLVEDVEAADEIEEVELKEVVDAQPTGVLDEAATVEVPNADEMDLEIIGVFFEEADEIMETVDQNIQDWSEEPTNLLFLENLLRGLHTLKGGARLSGLTTLGDLTHQFESFLIDVQASGGAIDDGMFDKLHDRHDELAGLLKRTKEAIELDVAVAERQTEPVPPVEEVVVQPEPKSDLEAQQAREPTPATAPRDSRAGQEMVRVGSVLLENLVNLAGESSIIRARLEQGMSDFTSALDEMETTIERVREQLRRLEIETETQVLFRQEVKDGPSYEEFDPLEMDRYSHLQQLSRGLSESASDMLDLKETLLVKARESETLLIQQARINTELQEGLMRTRMVPFNRLLPRLRRIVRQIAKELDKQVEFHAYNAEGELDRNLLERMVAPLEHMLRNAVDHGIESAALRRGNGKPEVGRIDLRLSREGGDVVIEISDDGAGIDIETVREKAVERGLMAADADLRDDEISQFVLAPGFTTAKSVTQISGRGVGMDVVHSAVKQLGGSINIYSRAGKGSRFVVRVPFTVSVNRALMVAVKEDIYAIPLNTIEGIVLLTPAELEKLYAGEGKAFEYAGIAYRVRYLGHYLGRDFQSAEQRTSVPVVLVRSGDQSIAIHVDAVQGSREIVVKSLGTQFAGVGGISGATILGDGSVVVILDLLALIRGTNKRGAARRGRSRSGRARCVMVVDDSVTVRKVTSRLLERQGMEVVVAKDGVEAVAMLQERRPDIMLLDIEMPRMDGFEVARLVRHDERLGTLPIIMLSSRTGEKHQEHANELGVNKFLGKPFQENELLATIDELINSE